MKKIILILPFLTLSLIHTNKNNISLKKHNAITSLKEFNSEYGLSGSNKDLLISIEQLSNYNNTYCCKVKSNYNLKVIKPSNLINDKIIWEFSIPKHCTITNNSLYCNQVGTVTIKAYCQSDYSKNCQFNVKIINNQQYFNDLFKNYTKLNEDESNDKEINSKIVLNNADNLGNNTYVTGKIWFNSSDHEDLYGINLHKYSEVNILFSPFESTNTLHFSLYNEGHKLIYSSEKCFNYEKSFKLNIGFYYIKIYTIQTDNSLYYIALNHNEITYEEENTIKLTDDFKSKYGCVIWKTNYYPYVLDENCITSQQFNAVKLYTQHEYELNKRYPNNTIFIWGLKEKIELYNSLNEIINQVSSKISDSFDDSNTSLTMSLISIGESTITLFLPSSALTLTISISSLIISIIASIISMNSIMNYIDEINNLSRIVGYLKSQIDNYIGIDHVICIGNAWYVEKSNSAFTTGTNIFYTDTYYIKTLTLNNPLENINYMNYEISNIINGIKGTLIKKERIY